MTKEELDILLKLGWPVGHVELYQRMNQDLMLYMGVKEKEVDIWRRIGRILRRAMAEKRQGGNHGH